MYYTNILEYVKQAKLLWIVSTESLIDQCNRQIWTKMSYFFSEDGSRFIELCHSSVINILLVNFLCNNKSHRFAHIGMFNNESSLNNWQLSKWKDTSECFVELSRISVQKQCNHYNDKANVHSASYRQTLL